MASSSKREWPRLSQARPAPHHDPAGRSAELALFRIPAPVRSDAVRRFFCRSCVPARPWANRGVRPTNWLCFARLLTQPPAAHRLQPIPCKLALFRRVAKPSTTAFPQRICVTAAGKLALFRTLIPVRLNWLCFASRVRPRLGPPPGAGVLPDSPANWLCFADSLIGSPPSIHIPHSAFRTPHSAFRIPQSAIRNPMAPPTSHFKHQTSNLSSIGFVSHHLAPTYDL